MININGINTLQLMYFLPYFFHQLAACVSNLQLNTIRVFETSSVLVSIQFVHCVGIVIHLHGDVVYPFPHIVHGHTLLPRPALYLKSGVRPLPEPLSVQGAGKILMWRIL